MKPQTPKIKYETFCYYFFFPIKKLTVTTTTCNIINNNRRPLCLFHLYWVYDYAGHYYHLLFLLMRVHHQFHSLIFLPYMFMFMYVKLIINVTRWQRRAQSIPLSNVRIRFSLERKAGEFCVVIIAIDANIVVLDAIIAIS